MREKDLLIRKGKGEPKYEFEKLLVRTLAGHNLSKRGQNLAWILPRLMQSLERESVAMDLFVEEPTKAQERVRIPGLVMMGSAIAILFIMPFIMMLLDDPLFMLRLPLVMLLLLSLVMLGIVGALAVSLVAPRMPKRTRQGVREAALWEAFRNHLREVFQQRDLAKDYLDLWDSYLPYAIIFGYQNRWINRFAEIHAPAPYWFHTSVSHGPTPESGGVPLTLDDVRQAFCDMFSYISDTLAIDSSGAGGGFGGGFGGGGGGGGGGAG